MQSFGCLVFMPRYNFETKMACPSHWKDIEDKFFECSICLDLFKEPKLLPCLHRFCKQCLEPILEGKVGTFECPLCKDVCKITNNRIDGFKTDFHMKSMLQFIQLQKTFENREERECIGCEEKLKVTAYCFMCKEFLCVQCYQFHLTKKIFAKHQKHVLGLNDLERKSLTQEKLASLMEAPRCHTHTEHMAQLCCCTCGNLPVCVTCTYGKHKGHDLQDVANVSKEEREKLQKRLEELEKRKENVPSLTNKINKVNAELTSIVTDAKSKWKMQYEDQTRKLKNKKEKEKREFNRFKTVLEERSRKELKELETEMEEKIRIIREDYDRMIKIKLRESKEKEDTKQNELENRELRIDEIMNKLDAVMNERNKTIEEQQQRKLRETQNLSDLCNQWVNKFENLSTIASSVLESHNHWTDAQCIPDIRAASEPLVEDIMKDFPEMESLSDITMDDLPMLCIDRVNISDNVESVVDVDVMKGNEFCLTGITSTGSGYIVVSGRLSRVHSFITVINRQGCQIRHDKIDEVIGSSLYPNRYCAALSRDKIASVCTSNQVVVYNIHDGSFTQNNITSLFDDIKTMKTKVGTCITTDPIHGHIIVGTYIGSLFIFDEEFKFIRALKLPEVIKWSRDILYHEGVLLICDLESRCAYAVTMDTSKAEAELLYKLPKPDIDGKTWYPCSICADRAGFVYILWSLDVQCTGQGIITQYSQDGQQLLTTKRTEDTARCMTTLMTEEGEKLLVATTRSGKMLCYGLTPE
ncbi:uncharacterized protein [Apostichopus japonicus]|uniref:uncharacterized protein isoform X2 n=1 Tax=Stichopus japonicus TaxID=307972 RepID=UPI003AB6F404